jgi:hypothetical protein
MGPCVKKKHQEINFSDVHTNNTRKLQMPCKVACFEVIVAASSFTEFILDKLKRAGLSCSALTSTFMASQASSHTCSTSVYSELHCFDGSSGMTAETVLWAHKQTKAI